MLNRIATSGYYLVMASLVIGALCAGPLTGVSSADVTIYSEVWPAEDTDANGNLEIFSLGSGDSDDRPFTLTAYLRDPSLNTLAWGNSSGWGYREVNKSTVVTESSPEGQYSNLVSADQGPEHYGCLVGAAQFIIDFGRFYTDGTPTPGATSWTYNKCQGDGCNSVNVKLSKFPPGTTTFPAVAQITSFGISYWLGNVCIVKSAEARAGCIG